MKRIHLFLISFTFVIFGCIDNTSTKPNILLIQADDLGYSDLAVHGNSFVETPAIDKLAKTGLQFSNFYVNSVCAPTRASLLTGRHFLRTGVSHVHGGKDFIHLEETLLPEALNENGYTCGMWGKWHSGKTKSYFPWERGFDEAYMAQLYKHENSRGQLNGVPVTHKKWASEVITDYAIEFIRNNKKAPFFAYLSFLTVHAPLRAPETLISKYEQKGLSRNLSTIYAMVDQMDSCIQVLAEEVEKSGLAENTLFVFLSDNGPAVINHLLSNEDRQIRYVNKYKGHKGNLWENGVKSPLFVNWKNHIKPGISEQLLDVCDLYPTLVKLAGGKFPKKQQKLDGIDFSGILKGGKDKLNKTVFNWVSPGWPPTNLPWSPEGIEGEYQPFNNENKNQLYIANQLMSIRTNNRKLLQHPGKSVGTVDPDKGFVLIDMENDPKETKNISSTESFEQNQKQLFQWFQHIIESPYSFTSPEFSIGKEASTILAYAPQKISKGLTNTSFYIKGWGKESMEAEYLINVKDEGKYLIQLEFTDSLSKSITFKLEVNAHTISKICNGKSSKLGTLQLKKGKQVLHLSSMDGNNENPVKLSSINAYFKDD